jgi:hypothetical protein
MKHYTDYFDGYLADRFFVLKLLIATTGLRHTTMFSLLKSQMLLTHV